MIRKYTPVPPNICNEEQVDCPSRDTNDCVCLHFLIKIYAEGPFTSQLDLLPEGSSLEISEPTGSFDLSILDGTNLIAIAAGTGFTPMVRLIVETLRHNK